MIHEYQALYQHGKIGRVELKNRIFKPAAEDSCSGDGFVPEYLVRFYAEEAKGGAGLIICGMNVVTPWEKPGLDRHPLIEKDDRIPGYGQMAQAIQDHGAAACCQIGHFGSHGEPVSPEWARCVSEEALLEPGAEEWFTMFNMMYWHMMPPYPHKAYSVDEIHQLVGQYGDAALRAKKAGFDMVEIHGGHRHGLGCFLSPLTNRRNDEYGGTTAKRSRILYEIVEDIQKKCGKDYPIIVRLNGKDGAGVLHYQPAVTQGQQIEDTVEMAKQLEAMGVAALDISIQDTNVPMQAPFGVALEGAEAVRKAVSIPVMVACSIEIPNLAKEVLENGIADYIGTARQLYADPDWPNKLRRGRKDDIKPCIRCMECVNNDRHQWYGPLCCTVNPSVGKDDMRLFPACESKKVAVVGAGPAGLEAARVCKLRGHDVTIYEKNRIGGLLHEASTPDFKADIRKLLTYYEHQIQTLNIPVVHKEADIQDLEGYDAVIAATGSKPIQLQVPGSDRDNVYVAVDILSDLPEMGQKVTVIGGGSVGVETAIWLAQQGKTVTVCEMRDAILTEEMIINMVMDQELIMQNHVQVLTGRALKSIQADSVTVTDAEGQEEQIPTDAVVIAVGLRADRTLRDTLYETSDAEIYAAGDTNKPRKIYDAIHEGYVAAMQI